jgi:hypothetical protein
MVTYLAGIFGATASNGSAVYINSDGQLGTTPSSARFKQNIRSMDKASEAVLGLRSVTFRYKSKIDRSGTLQFGLVAEEVEKVNPNLVVHDKEGNPYSVRYDQVNAMLLNEFLKAHRKMEEQQKQIEVLRTQLKQQAKPLQDVSVQVGLNKPVHRVVLNNP